jgi:hypothetical protein
LNKKLFLQNDPLNQTKMQQKAKKFEEKIIDPSDEISLGKNFFANLIPACRGEFWLSVDIQNFILRPKIMHKKLVATFFDAFVDWF